MWYKNGWLQKISASECRVSGIPALRLHPSLSPIKKIVPIETSFLWDSAFVALDCIFVRIRCWWKVWLTMPMRMCDLFRQINVHLSINLAVNWQESQLNSAASNNHLSSLAPSNIRPLCNPITSAFWGTYIYKTWTKRIWASRLCDQLTLLRYQRHERTLLAEDYLSDRTHIRRLFFRYKDHAPLADTISERGGEDSSRRTRVS